MKTRKQRFFVSDFETTVYEGQEDTQVWAAACVEMYTEDVSIFHSIDELFEYFFNLNENIVCFFHNLKFDGEFWIYYLIQKLHYTLACEEGEMANDFKWLEDKDMPHKSFKCSITNLGQWYTVTIKNKNKTIQLRDSLKLLPFSVKQIGKDFKTKHQKLNMKYEGFRYPGCEITDEEKQYIANDVLVVKEALEIAFNEGHNKLTIGACCLSEFKKTIGGKYFNNIFPNLYEEELDNNLYGSPNVGEYIKKSYRGGWCYVVEEKRGKLFKNGLTADVNSLYPSVMYSGSGCSYPIGLPTFWKGNYIPDEAYNKYYFVRLKTRFYLNPGYLPFIQIKNSFKYKSTQMLRTSDIYNKEDGMYYAFQKDLDGQIKPCTVTMTMTCTDFKRFIEFYELLDFEILDGCYFNKKIGLFDDYIDKYKKIKMTSKGAIRTLAKLFLNNLYGKMAASTNSSFKVPFIKEDKSVGFRSVEAYDKKPGYIPIGSAITSYARDFTIRAAQKNYHGVDKPGFIYADTDSIHCDLKPEELIDIPVDDNAFSHWKLESYWDEGIFIRQKTYMEHVTHENGTPIEPHYEIKCAGMPDKCKALFLQSMTNPITDYETQKDKLIPELKDVDLSQKEIEFISKKKEKEDFNVGLIVPGKLVPTHIKGGVLLQQTTYELREIY